MRSPSQCRRRRSVQVPCTPCDAYVALCRRSLRWGGADILPLFPIQLVLAHGTGPSTAQEDAAGSVRTLLSALRSSTSCEGGAAFILTGGVDSTACMFSITATVSPSPRWQRTARPTAGQEGTGGKRLDSIICCCVDGGRRSAQLALGEIILSSSKHAISEINLCWSLDPFRSRSNFRASLPCPRRLKRKGVSC